jgi:hypothetical protein
LLRLRRGATPESIQIERHRLKWLGRHRNVTIVGGDQDPRLPVEAKHGDVIAKLDEQKGSRLVRIPAAGGPPQAVPFTGEYSMLTNPLIPGSIRKNQLLLPLSSVDSWDYHAGVLDLATGDVTRLPMNEAADVHLVAYAADGSALLLVLRIDSTLWKFEPKPVR